MIINNIQYKFIEKSPVRINIVDSFVARDQALGTSSSAERKLYIRKGNLSFFGGPGFNARSAVRKSNLLALLNGLKPEYLKPQRPYGQQLEKDKRPAPKPSGNLGKQFPKRLSLVNNLSDFTFFDFKQQSQAGGGRFYGKGGKKGKPEYDPGYRPLFTLPIPGLSVLDISKYQSTTTARDEIFLFELFHSQTGQQRAIHPYFDVAQKAIENNLPSGKKGLKQKFVYQKAREGQGKYRKGVMAKFKNGCLLTGIKEDYLLHACHIIPYIHPDATVKDKINTNNGLALTPTAHKLFDEHKISFDKNKLVVADNLSAEVNKNLGLQPGRVFIDMPKGCYPYLQWHLDRFNERN